MSTLSDVERQLYRQLQKIFRKRYGNAANIYAYLAINEIRKAGIDPHVIDPQEIDPQDPWGSFDKLLCKLSTRRVKEEMASHGLSDEEMRLIVESAEINALYNMMLKHEDKKAVRRALLALTCLQQEKLKEKS